MENRFFSAVKAILLLLYVLFSAAAFAQEIEDDGLQESEISAQEQWQYLEWEEENPEYVLHYEVVIEVLSEKKGTFEELNRIMTEDNSNRVQVNPLLPPGVYRYKVISTLLMFRKLSQAGLNLKSTRRSSRK